MSCIWKLFKKKKVPSQPLILTDLRVQNPLNLDEIPDNITMLRAVEAAIIENLISIHYKLEETKNNIKYVINKGFSHRLKENLAKRTVLTERKRILEGRLQKIQERLQEMKNTQ